MARGLLLSAAILALAATARPACAFTPDTRIRIVESAITLMPPALRRQLERHDRALLRSALVPLREGEGGPAHILDETGGEADAALQEAVREAVRALDRQAPFSEVVRFLGRVAHVAADLAFPLNVSSADPREPGFYDEYATYVQSRTERFRLIWNGWHDPHLAANDLSGFARAAAEASRRDYDFIVRAYHPEGRASLPQDFDDRSTAFAAASLAYSRAVGLTAKTWMYVWSRAHGDRSGTPYLGPGRDPFVKPPPPPPGNTPP